MSTTIERIEAPESAHVEFRVRIARRDIEIGGADVEQIFRSLHRISVAIVSINPDARPPVAAAGPRPESQWSWGGFWAGGFLAMLVLLALCKFGVWA